MEKARPSRLSPPPPAGADPYALDARALPPSLEVAVAELEGDPLYRRAFGEGFVAYYAMMKRAELARYEAATAGVTSEPETAARRADWQLREYFEFF